MRDYMADKQFMLKRIARFMLLDNFSLGLYERAIWKKSALRIMSLFGILLVAAIIIHLQIVDVSSFRFHRTGISLVFLFILVSTFISKGLPLSFYSAAFIGLVYAASISIFLFAGETTVVLLAFGFLLITPALARIFFGYKLSVVLSLFNLVPFFFLLGNLGVTENFVPLYPKSPYTLVYISILFFLIFNLALPVALSRLLNTLERSFARFQDLNKRLYYNEQLYRSVFDISGTAAIICESDGTIAKINREAEVVAGYKADEVEEKMKIDSILFFDENRPVELHQPEQDSMFAFTLLTKEGEKKYVLVRFGIITGSDRYVITIFDLDASNCASIALEHSREREKYFSEHDYLTGLPNRSSFLSLTTGSIKEHLASGKCGVMVCIGLDRFKYINENYGISIGDTVLNLFALRLKSTLPHGDIIGRLGGDMFLCFISDINTPDEFLAELKELQQRFDFIFSVQGFTIEITASIGIAFYPGDGMTAEALVRNSELALHAAKEAGQGNCAVYDRDINQHLKEQYYIENEIKNAIKNNLFEIHYQPKVDYSGELTGFEALVRWKDSYGKYISPDIFIPAAEELGIINLIDRYIITKVCSDIKNVLHIHDIVKPVSVNISAKNFSLVSILDFVIETVESFDLDPSFVEIEITETGIMNNEKSAIAVLGKLTSRGFNIIIDDFGTGYSSLNKLKDFPVRTIKIDKSFVDEIPGNAKAENIIRTIVSLANHLDFSLVAEGVERREQVEFLNELGCEVFQGYHFFRPLPVSEIVRLFTPTTFALK